MKWIKATEVKPKEDAVIRYVDDKTLIPNQHIHSFHDDHIEMDNGYDRSGINGTCHYYNQLEWLDESAPSEFGEWQCCPKCLGQGVIGFPPYAVPGSTPVSTSAVHQCDVCSGDKLIPRPHMK